jgi:hypothetical protein
MGDEMNRMHREDLKAILMASTALSIGTITGSDIQRGSEIADAILAELSRTAAPEYPKGITPPKNPMEGGFNLEEFCKGWMADEFAAYLDELMAASPEPPAEPIRVGMAATLEQELRSAKEYAEALEAERDKLSERAKGLEARQSSYNDALTRAGYLDSEDIGVVLTALVEDFHESTAGWQGMQARLAEIDAAARKLPGMPDPVFLGGYGTCEHIDKLTAYATLMQRTAARLKGERDKALADAEGLRKELDRQSLVIPGLQNNIRNLHISMDEAKSEAEGLRRDMKEGHLWPATWVWSSEKMPDGKPVRGASVPDWAIADIKSDATKSERERLMPWVMHKNGCPTGRYSATKPTCTCGLRGALAPKPQEVER